MRLLIITQVVDKNYVPLCFFVEWLREFGKNCDRVTVIGQKVGEYELPENVNVLSLKKEDGLSRMRQILRAWRLMWFHRKEYDAVLVHMTPIWVVLGAPIWMLLRKRMYLWYEARGTRWHLRLSLKIVKKAFSASPGGMPLPTKKSVLTGHGIDINFFAPSDNQRDSNLVITVGRLTRAKRLELIVDAFAALPASCQLTIIGMMITEEDKQTVEDLKSHIAKLDFTDRVTFATISDNELRDLLQRATLFLHASNATSLDKAPLQAMASGCLVVTASPVVKPHVPEECRAEEGTMGAVASRLLSMPPEEQSRLRQTLRHMIEEQHSLPRLIERLTQEMSS